MRRIYLVITLMFSMSVCGQTSEKEFLLKDSVNVVQSGVQRIGDTYVEYYNVLTDSIVRRFGLVFRIKDSTFVRKIEVGSMRRKDYDKIELHTKRVREESERRRQDTIDFLNRYRTSYDVWSLFMLYGILR